MATVYRLIVFFLSLSSIAAKAESICDSKVKISLPPEMIYFYLNTSESIKIFPLGNQKCDLGNKTLKIENSETNEFVAEFMITDTVKTNLDSISLIQKKTHPTVISTLASFKKGIDPIKFISLLNNLVNPLSSVEFNKEIYFLIGKVKNLEISKINWNPYQDPQNHWAAKNITYNDLIQFYAQKNIQYIHIGNLDSYYIPIVNNQTKYLSLEQISKYSIENLIFNAQVKLTTNSFPIVVLSKASFNTQGYNTITNLFQSGYRQIYWLRDSLHDWRASRAPTASDIYSKDFNLLSNKNLLDLFKQNVPIKILDLSDEILFQYVHFKKSIRKQVIFYTAQQMNDYMKTNKPNEYESFMKTDYAYDGMHVLSNPENDFDKYSTIIITSNDHYINAPMVKSIGKQLQKAGYKVNILEPNAGEFLNYLISNKIDPRNYVDEPKNLFLSK